MRIEFINRSAHMHLIFELLFNFLNALNVRTKNIPMQVNVRFRLSKCMHACIYILVQLPSWVLRLQVAWLHVIVLRPILSCILYSL